METNDLYSIHFPEPDREFDFSEAVTANPEKALAGFGGWTLDAFALDNVWTATVDAGAVYAGAGAAFVDAGAVCA